MKNRYKKIILFIFIFFMILFLFFSCFFLRHYFSVFYFQNDINKISVNIELNAEENTKDFDNINEIYICFSGDCDKMKPENNIYSYKLNQENPLFYKDISNVELVFKNTDIFNRIRNITLFCADKFNYFNPNDLFVNQINFNDEIMYSINLPFNGNSKDLLKKIAVYFEALFYNWYFFITGYILIILYFIKCNKKINFDNRLLLPLIFIIALLLRLSHIDFVPLWNDELYTLTVIWDLGSGFNLKNIFLDPGNPPLFFLLSNIWLKFFHNSVIEIRMLSVLIGTVDIFIIYWAVNKILDRKAALICAFLSATNIFIIMESNEIRSYILSMGLIVFGALSFWKLYQKKTNKNFVFYFIISILLINVHFYCLLFVLFNFISGLAVFKNTRMKFLFVNFIAFLSFLFYFLISCKKSFDSTFNTWLSKPDLSVLNNHIVFYFGNFIFFIITIVFLVYMFKKLQKQEKQIVIYLVSSIAFVFVFAYVFSWMVKPILFERYFCIFLPFLIIITSIFLVYDYKTKFKPLILISIFLFSINIAKYENFNLFSNIYFTVKYAAHDYLKYDEDYDIYLIVPDNKKYINYYKNDFKLTKKPQIIVSNNGIKENIDMLDEYVKNSKKKKIVFYLPEICTNQTVKKRYNAQKIAASILPVYKIFVVK